MSYSCFLFVLHCYWCQDLLTLSSQSGMGAWMVLWGVRPDHLMVGGGHRRATGSEYTPSLKKKKKEFVSNISLLPLLLPGNTNKNQCALRTWFVITCFCPAWSLFSSHSEGHLWPILNPKQLCFINPLASEQIPRCCPLPWWWHLNAWSQKKSLTARAFKKCT